MMLIQVDGLSVTLASGMEPSFQVYGPERTDLSPHGEFVVVDSEMMRVASCPSRWIAEVIAEALNME